MGEQSAAWEEGPWNRVAGAKCLLGGLQIPKDGASVVQDEGSGEGLGPGDPRAIPHLLR